MNDSELNRLLKEAKVPERPPEFRAQFPRRVTARLEPDRRWDEDAADRADFVAVLAGDVTPRSGAEVYALHPRLLDRASVTLVDAPHLLAVLAPDTRARATLRSV